jgi:2-iminobutanoate/2-iminopropanoate deaminase
MHDNTPDHPYSLVRSADGRTAYVSGVLPYDAAGSVVTERDRAVVCVVEELAARLRTVGLGLDAVVKTTVFLTDLSWRDAVNRVWFDTFSPPRPARTAVEVRRLPRDSPIEIEAVAQLPQGHRVIPEPAP